MKKLVLTLVIAISSVMAFAKNNNSSLVSYNNSQLFTSEKIDNHISRLDRYTNAQVTVTTPVLSKIVFYDVDRIVIENSHNQYIKIEDRNGKVIIESHDNVDVNVVPGDYYIYTSANHMTGYYRYKY